MQPETPALPERWHAETRLLMGATEHVIASPALDGHGCLSIVAGAIDALTELGLMLADDDAPPLPDNVHREIWHWRVAWNDPDGIEHVAQSWTPDAAELWRDVSEAVESLLFLREMLRQTRRRPPRALGDTWDEHLAAYDAKAAASALSDAELEAHMATRRPPGTPG